MSPLLCSASLPPSLSLSLSLSHAFYFHASQYATHTNPIQLYPNPVRLQLFFQPQSFDNGPIVCTLQTFLSSPTPYSAETANPSVGTSNIHRRKGVISQLRLCIGYTSICTSLVPHGKTVDNWVLSLPAGVLKLNFEITILASASWLLKLGPEFGSCQKPLRMLQQDTVNRQQPTLSSRALSSPLWILT
jgi:hypothetical protein